MAPETVSSQPLLIPPIFRLPAEITVAIFLDVVAYSGPLWNWNITTILMLVCKDWYEFVLTSPQLWATIDSAMLASFSPSRLSEVLLRSEEYPLGIHLSGRDFDYSSKEELERLKMGLQIVAGHANRIAVFEATSMTSDALTIVFTVFKQHPAHTLRYLRLEIDRYVETLWQPKDLTWPLFDGDMPMLQHVIMRDMPTAWPSSRNTVLLNIREDFLPVKLLLAALKHTTRLQRLYLNATEYEVDDLDKNVDNVVKLPHLTHMRIFSDMPMELQFLQYLSLPKTAAVALTFKTHHPHSQTGIIPDSLVIRDVGARTHTLTLEFRIDRGTAIVLHSPTKHVKITYRTVSFNSIPENVYCGLGVVPLPALKSLTVQGHATLTFLDGEWRRVLSSLLSLTELSLKDAKPTLLPLIRLFGTVMESDGSESGSSAKAPSVYCPQLFTLSMTVSGPDEFVFVDALATSIVSRASVGSRLNNCNLSLKVDDSIQKRVDEIWSTGCRVFIDDTV
ncbi:uncharacterized protein FIBRA_02221 [Fibroporia radiculosa]|uniref:Uncharacterized protein n=1 Tax=Fibroporia radiculosa TaxID=599839 RepID=J4G1F1_9APHY|nr:uncharacterized protein FIBRA_02221 [Fibroporia radiculosa]CCM00193.1 predicted protein [Fibroporia radiculosa]